MMENLIKNILLLIILIFSYGLIQTSLMGLNLDRSVAGSFLASVSILIVTACFGNFAFTYEKVAIRNSSMRFLGHLTTGLLMLLIGLSLEMASVFSSILIGSFPVFNLSLVILYAAVILYDFWDLKRAEL